MGRAAGRKSHMSLLGVGWRVSMGHHGMLIFITETLYIHRQTYLKSTIESWASDACMWPSFLSQPNEPRKQKNVFTALSLLRSPG